MKAWTDYPIEELDDTLGEIAPVREVNVLSYDGNKYCKVEIGGCDYLQEIKSAYLYQRPGRVTEVPSLTRRQLHYLDNSQ